MNLPTPLKDAALTDKLTERQEPTTPKVREPRPEDFGFKPSNEPPSYFVPEGAKPEKTPIDKVYDVDKGITIGIPRGKDLDEINLSVQTQIHRKPKENFFGGVEVVGDYFQSFAKGAYYDVVSKSVALGGLLRSGDADPTPVDLVKAMDPLNVQDSLKARTKTYRYLLNRASGNALDKAADRLVNAATNHLVKNKIEPKEGFDNELAFGLGQGAMSALSSIGLAYATRNPNLVGSLFGLQQKGLKRVQLDEMGKPKDEADDLSTIYAIPEGGLEAMGLDIFINALRGSAVVRRTLLRSATEAIQEGSQQLSEGLLDKWAAKTGTSYEDIAYNVGFAALIGGLIGLPAGGMTTFLEENSVLGRIRKDENLNQAEVDAVAKEIQLRLDPNATRVVKTILDREAAELELKTAEAEQKATQTEKPKTPAEQKAVEVVDRIEQKGRVQRLQELRQDIEDNRDQMSESEYAELVEAVDGVLSQDGQSAQEDVVRDEDGNVLFSRKGYTPLEKEIRSIGQGILPKNTHDDRSWIMPSGAVLHVSSVHEEILGRKNERAAFLEGWIRRGAYNSFEFYAESDIAKRNLEDLIATFPPGWDDRAPWMTGDIIIDPKYYYEGGDSIAYSRVIQYDDFVRSGFKLDKFLSKIKPDPFMEWGGKRHKLLTRDLQAQKPDPTQTPEFKAWFGDSKVVDEYGRPLVVYHSTMNVFSAFDAIKAEQSAGRFELGFHFGSQEQANNRIGSDRFGDDIINDYKNLNRAGKFPNIIPAYIRLLNPLYMPSDIGDWSDVSLLKEYLGPANYEVFTYKQMAGWQTADDARRALLRKGYDGLIYMNEQEGRGQSWIVFTPEQIKSATGNRGTFDPSNPDIRFSMKGQAQPTFFSALERTIQEKMPAVASADQVRGILKNTQGIKQEEVEWLDIESFLSDKPKVTKADLLDYIRANNVQIQEVVKGDFKQAEIVEEGNHWLVKRPSGMVEEYYSYSDAVIAAKSRMGNVEATKFANYQLPGGENYRELLLTLPATENQAKKARQLELIQKMQKFGTDALDEKEWAEYEAGRKDGDASFFRSSHFDEPNVLAHVRFNERTDAEGKRVLFIEEVQSDWAQKGRKEGFVGENKLPPGWTIRQSKGPSPVWQAVDQHGQVTASGYESEAEIMADMPRIARTRFGGETRVPNMPFKKTESWTGLAMKRVLRYAVENGFDKIAWTTGEQQAERYDLSKQIDELLYQPVKDSDGNVTEYKLLMFKNGEQVADTTYVEPEKLADAVGKEVAERIKNNEGEENTKWRASSGGGATLAGNVLKDSGLKVGGEGMKGFYDQMLPSFMNKYTKKWGGRVGTTKIETETPFTENDVRITDPTMDETGRFSVGPDYYKNKKGPELVNVHSLEITPAMRESVMGGQPLFSRQRGQGGLSIEQVEARVELFRKGFKRMPRIRVEEADSRVPADAEAYYDAKNREIVVLADRISDMSRLDYVILHEAIGHFGLRAVLGDKFDATMRSIYESNEGIRKRADEVMATYKYSQAVATEEALAELAGTVTETDLGLWKGAIAAFKSVVRDQIGVDLAFSDNDVLALISNARAYVQGKTNINRQARGAAAEYAQAVEDARSARDELEATEAMLKQFKGRIRPYKNGYLAEELGALPRYFMAGPGDPGITADEVAGELAAMNAGFTGDSDDQAIAFLAKAHKRAQELRKEAKEPTAPRINARADKYVELLDRPTMKKYLATVEKARARVAELKAMSLEKRSELRAEMQRKIVAMRDALLDRIRLGQAKREELVAFINEAVPVAERGRFLKLVARTKDTTDMAKAMIRIQEARDKYAKKVALERVKKAFDRALGSQSVAIEYHKVISGMAEALDESTPRPQTLKALKATRDYIDKELAEGRDPGVPRYVYESLGRLRAVPLASLSVAELQNITDRVQSLAEIGKIKLQARQRVYELTKERYLRELLAGSVAIDDSEAEAPKIGKSRQSFSERLSRATRAGADLWYRKMPMDTFFDLLDGLQEYQGVNSRIFKANIDAAFGEYLVLKQKVDDKIVKLNDKLGLTEENFQRIGVYAVVQQENGLEKLLNTGYKQADIDAAIQLTADEMTMYKAMRKALDEMRPLIAEVMRVTYNKDLEYVEDYFPFMTDFEAMGDAEIQDRFGNDVEQFGMKPKRNVKKGFTIKRVNDKKQAVRIDAMRVFLNHMDNASYLVTVGPQVKMLAEVADTREYVKAAGTRGQRMVMEWLDIVARKGAPKGSSQPLNRGMDALRRLTGKAQLGFRLSTILIQPTALFDGAAIIGGDRVAQGVNHVAFSREWRQFLRDNFPELRERGADDPAYLEMGQDKWTQAAFWPIKQMDLLAASAVTAGAYELAMAKRGKAVDLANPDKEAIAEATRLMRRSQSSAFFKDAPLLITQGLMQNASFTKLLTQFQTFVLNRWSIIEHDLVRYGVKKGKKGQMVNGFIFMALAMMSEPMIRRWSKELIAILTGAELDDYEPEDYWEDVAEQFFTTIPIVSQMVNTAKWGDVPIPSLAFVKDLGDTWSYTWQSKSDEKRAKWITNLLVKMLLLSRGGAGMGQLSDVSGKMVENLVD